MRMLFLRPAWWGRQTGRAGVLAALGAAVLLSPACGGEAPQPPVEEATSVAPAGPVPGRLYVSDETGGNVIVIDPAAGEIVTRIPVGKRPRGIRLSNDGARLFVALSGSPIAPPGVDESTLPPADRSADGIGVVDLSAGKVERVLESGQDPETFDLSPDETAIYVSNEETAEMSRLDVAKGAIVARVTVGGEPEGVAVRPGGGEVYVTSEEDNSVAIIDTAANKLVTSVAVVARPRDIIFAEDGAIAFVTGENAAALSVIDANARKVITTIKIPQVDRMPAPPRPMSGVLSADGQQVFISLGRAGAIAVIDVAKRAFVRSILEVGARPWGIGLSADGRTLYTANGPSGDVSVIDIATDTVRRISTGGSPWGLVVAR